MKIGQRRCEEEKRKKRNTRKEDFEIFVEAVSGRQKTKVLGMTSREDLREDLRRMETRKSATGETTKNLHLAEDTRSTLGIEWMRWVPMQLVRGAIL